MNNVKIIRLQSGEDLICDLEKVHHQNDKYILKYPMSFQVINKPDSMRILLSFYLPVDLIEKNECILNERDILLSIDPTQEFLKYYENAVKNILKESNEPPNQSLMDTMVEAFNQWNPNQVIKH
jgi:hypothetical protein